MPNSPTPPHEIILLISPDEVTPVEGQRGWGETIQKREPLLMVEVRLDPTVLERQMAGFLGMVGRLFQQADEQMQAQSTLPTRTPPSVQLSEIEQGKRILNLCQRKNEAFSA